VFLELLNVAGRQLRWAPEELVELVDRLQRAGFEIVDPDLTDVARWVADGLTAYDASYVALAEQLSAKLVTDDRAILEIAPDVTQPLRS
jgi:predicted nucleic acid-binding protein